MSVGADSLLWFSSQEKLSRLLESVVIDLDNFFYYLKDNDS